MLLAFFHRDGIDYGFAGDAFQTGFDNVELGTVDHHRHAGNIRFGRDELQEGGHRLDSVKQAFIHVHVDNLRAVFNLLTGNIDGGGIIAGQDQLLEFG